jgi:uncharacterized protein (DUF433 family)
MRREKQGSVGNVDSLPMPEQGVSPTEAAFITGLSPKAVNAAIDRREISLRPVRQRGKSVRRLGVPELVYLALRPRLTRVLSAWSRRRLYQEIKRRSLEGEVFLSGSLGGASIVRATPVQIGVVVVNFDEALSQVIERMHDLAAASQYVVSDPDIRGGEPVVRGTWVPVYRLAELAEQGISEEELLEDHPSVSAEMLRAALTYARTHPRRGRPKRGPWHHAGERRTRAAALKGRRRAKLSL